MTPDELLDQLEHFGDAYAAARVEQTDASEAREADARRPIVEAFERLSAAEEFEEWRITGNPGPPFPPYDFVYSPDRNPQLGDPEQMARKFMAMLAERTPSWVDGPHLSKRVVRRTEWIEVER